MSESSPAGEPSSDNTDSSDNICPSCGREFDSYSGVRTHLFQHCDGEISGTCDNCGDDITDRPPAEIENSKRLFCDRACFGEWKSKNWVGENAPAWKGGNKVDCSYCGQRLHRDPNQIERSDNFFCGDKDCKAKWQRENVTGEDHPRWGGGYEDYYGKNWESKRREALQRDNHTCQACGSHKDETDAKIHVHHIIPINEFDEKTEANRLTNLVVLCEPCHGRWEGLYLRPDTR